MLTTIAAIAFLIFLSAFFSGAETALTAASRPVMHHLEREGDVRARLVIKLHSRRERLIGAILLGNNLVNVLASVLATSLLIGLAGESGVAYATILMTLLLVIFGEVLPKVYAIHNANRMSLRVARLISAVVVVLIPVTQALEVLVTGMLRLLRVRLGEEDAHAEEQLRGAIELHRGEDEEEVAEERAMLRSVLDLAEVTVGEIVTHRREVAALDVEQEPARIVEQVLESPYTRLPVWQGDPDNVVGVLHAKQLLREVWSRGGDLSRLNVADLAAKPWFIPESTTLLNQLLAFRARREHFALVVDEYGALMGIVTLEDILEEIVGEISDEHDLSVAGVRPAADGSFVVDGTVTIRDLNRQFDWQLPDEEAATIAGLVLYEARRIPEVGQVFRFHGFRFEVLRRRRNQITALKITPPPPPAD
ncbi:MAG: HlyC/CorC family transporter [Proteobacteria bacterium]|nr:HlyC/CorC family transporter [Pseudomonadota bacterium]